MAQGLRLQGSQFKFYGLELKVQGLGLREVEHEIILPNVTQPTHLWSGMDTPHKADTIPKP